MTGRTIRNERADPRESLLKRFRAEQAAQQALPGRVPGLHYPRDLMAGDPASPGGTQVAPEELTEALTALINSKVTGPVTASDLGTALAALIPSALPVPVAEQAGTYREAVLHSQQLRAWPVPASYSEPDVYIMPATLYMMPANPLEGAQLHISDGTVTEVYTFTATPVNPFDVQISPGSSLPNNGDNTQLNLMGVINAQSAVWAAHLGSRIIGEAFDLFFTGAIALPTIIVRKDPTALPAVAADRMWSPGYGPLVPDNNGFEVVDWRAHTSLDYTPTNGVKLNLPAADPGVRTFGNLSLTASIQLLGRYVTLDDGLEFVATRDQGWLPAAQFPSNELGAGYGFSIVDFSGFNIGGCTVSSPGAIGMISQIQSTGAWYVSAYLPALDGNTSDYLDWSEAGFVEFQWRVKMNAVVGKVGFGLGTAPNDFYEGIGKKVGFKRYGTRYQGITGNGTYELGFYSTAFDVLLNTQWHTFTVRLEAHRMVSIFIDGQRLGGSSSPYYIPDAPGDISIGVAGDSAGCTLLVSPMVVRVA